MATTQITLCWLTTGIQPKAFVVLVTHTRVLLVRVHGNSKCYS